MLISTSFTYEMEMKKDIKGFPSSLSDSISLGDEFYWRGHALFDPQWRNTFSSIFNGNGKEI